MNPTDRSQPSPTQDAWLFAALVRPSTADEEYASPRWGVNPPGAGGTRSGYDHVKSPLCPDTDQVADGDSGDALALPPPSGAFFVPWSPFSAASDAGSEPRAPMVCWVTGV